VTDIADATSLVKENLDLKTFKILIADYYSFSFHGIRNHSTHGFQSKSTSTVQQRRA
jgi:hypothetical protein